MDRCRLPLVAFLLIAIGCGGNSVPVPGVDYPALGAASMDLALSGGFGDTAKSMVGKGSTRGAVSIVSPSGDGVAITEVKAVLPSTRVKSDGTRLTQTLILRLNQPETLAAGATFAIDGTTNAAEYDETQTVVKGATYGDSVTEVAKATAGTLEVASFEGTAITLRLTNATFALQGLDDPTSTPPIVASGTISGTVIASVDMG